VNKGNKASRGSKANRARKGVNRASRDSKASRDNKGSKASRAPVNWETGLERLAAADRMDGPTTTGVTLKLVRLHVETHAH
jgi:hypothetical protein